MSRAVFSQEAQVVSLLLGAFALADDERSADKIVSGRKAGGLDVSSRLFISSNLLHGYCCKTTLTFYKTGYPNDANYSTNCCSGLIFLITYPVFTSPLTDKNLLRFQNCGCCRKRSPPGSNFYFVFADYISNFI